MITRDEFIRVPPPMYYLRIEGGNVSPDEKDMIEDWIDEHCSGWVYFDSVKTYVFQNESDRLLFRLWLSGDRVFLDASR